MTRCLADRLRQVEKGTGDAGDRDGVDDRVVVRVQRAGLVHHDSLPPSYTSPRHSHMYPAPPHGHEIPQRSGVDVADDGFIPVRERSSHPPATDVELGVADRIDPGVDAVQLPDRQPVANRPPAAYSQRK
jgi:hypothetical protein